MGDRQVVSVEMVRTILARHLQLSALDIKVETRGDTVFLSGEVDLLAEKLTAEEIVRQMQGVQRVENELTIAQEGVYQDQEIEEEIRVHLHQELRLASVAVKVHQGAVYLEGQVETLAEEDLAQGIAAQVRGVKEVISQLKVATAEPVDDAIIAQGLGEALAQRGSIDMDTVNIQIEQGVVHLSGLVETQKKREGVTRLVSGVEGVRRVVNNLLVEEEQDDGDVYLTNVIRQAMAQTDAPGLQRVQVYVVRGWAYLTGQVDTVDEKELVEDVVREVNENMGGLEGMTNDIVITLH